MSDNFLAPVINGIARARVVEPFFFDTLLKYEGVGLVYRAIPKNACSSLKYTFALLEKGMTVDEDPQAVENRFFTHSAFAKGQSKSLICLRDPLSRALSGFLDKICNLDEDFSVVAARDICNTLGLEQAIENITFEQFCVYLSVRPSSTLDIHWRPQTDFHIFPFFDNVIFFESIGKELALLTDYGYCKVEVLRYKKRDAFNKKKLQIEGASGLACHKIGALGDIGYLPDFDSFYNDNLADIIFRRFQDDFLLYAAYAKERNHVLPESWKRFGLDDRVEALLGRGASSSRQ